MGALIIEPYRENPVISKWLDKWCVIKNGIDVNSERFEFFLYDTVIRDAEIVAEKCTGDIDLVWSAYVNENNARLRVTGVLWASNDIDKVYLRMLYSNKQEEPKLHVMNIIKIDDKNCTLTPSTSETKT